MQYKPSSILLDMVDTTLFTCEYEVILLEDLRVYPEIRPTSFGPLGLVDMVEVVDRLLDSKKLLDMVEDRRNNYILMYTEVYNIMHDIATWDTITVDTGSIPVMKRVYKRLSNLLNTVKVG